ncbi:MAG: PQQ-binding-like beta-propeller repeat protein [Phycisphaera sp.]|nr:PQQ-binding-like beta-propeller repeat protein [Phycisphaera sp.]
MGLKHWLVCVVMVGAIGAASVFAADEVARGVVWPQWRGPGGQGITPKANVPLEWGASKNVTWKTAIHGTGYSSPVIEGDRIWVTTSEEVAADEADAKERLKVNTGNQPLNLAAEVRFFAVCVDAKSGKVLHDIELLKQERPQWVHRLNSYASPSPVIEPGRLYCHFGTFGTACVDTASGKVLWTNREHPIMHENGPGSSPVLVGDRLIIHCDGSDKQYIAALDTKTGKTAWRTDRSGTMRENPQLKKAYCTPLVAEIDGRKVVLSPAADWLYAYDPASGQELWKVSYGTLGFSNVARPVMDDEMIYLSTGFMRSEILAIRYRGVSTPEIAWRYNKNVSKIPSPLLVDGRLYFVSDEGGILTCLNAKTGEELFRERMGGAYAASPMYASGRVYLFSREGVATVLEPGDTFKVLAENKLDGAFMATPAVTGDALIMRVGGDLYRVEE